MQAMTEIEIARFAYLALLLAAILGWVLVEHRRSLGTLVRQAVGWGFIFLAAIAAYGLWGEIRTEIAPRQSVLEGGGRIELPRAPDGHFHLTLAVAGTPVRFLVDTGATSVVLSDRDAERLGIDRRTLAFTGLARTANGTIRTARVTLRDVTLGELAFGDIGASVGDGPLDVSLLGMEFLDRFARVEIAGNRMILTP
jgi:aspartyl protease family protein